MGFLERAKAGAGAGFLAGVGIALLFLLEGLVHLRPFSIPAALATGLLGGGSAPAAASPLDQVTSFVVVGFEVSVYGVLHLVTFAAVGAAAAFVLKVTSFWKSLWGGVAYGTLGCTGLLYVSRWFVDTPVALDVLGLRTVLLANAVAGGIIGIGLYLYRTGDVAGAASAPSPST